MSLSAAQFSVLSTVWHLQNEAGVGIRAIAEHIQFAAAHVIAEVSKLAEFGLLSKDWDSCDSLAIHARLSTKSLDHLAQVAPFMCDVNGRLRRNKLRRV